MITEVIRVTCDQCGLAVEQSVIVEYRISGAIYVCVKHFEQTGWVFRRDCGYKLEQTLCPKCAINVTPKEKL